MLDAGKAYEEFSNDPILGPIVLKWGICPLNPQTNYFEELCESIIGQQISNKVAAALRERFTRLLGDEITPEKVRELGIDNLRSLGISVRKAESIMDLAKNCLSGEIPLDEISSLKEEEIHNCLIKVKGIGPWTVTMFLIFALNRPRVIPAADFGIRKAIQILYSLRDLPQVADVQHYYENWKPHETIASWYLWRSLENDGQA